MEALSTTTVKYTDTERERKVDREVHPFVVLQIEKREKQKREREEQKETLPVAGRTRGKKGQRASAEV